ncbi:hypothetical protein DY000_02017255 [Brassica cretica]|uniref:Uncharacterized protein n=1 Tax=Brassica cretica TaxID=69181 RepID=A0ABQ7D9G2_BRACR|nr:hypothetical protein DY000_02017255 [Brassica cretica]
MGEGVKRDREEERKAKRGRRRDVSSSTKLREGEKIVHQWHAESLDEVHHLKRSITESNELSYLVIFVIRTNQNPQGIWRIHNRPGAWRFAEIPGDSRRFLSMIWPKIMQMPIGRLIEKLREMDGIKDRIRLDGLAR